MRLQKSVLSFLTCLPSYTYGVAFDLNVTVPDIVTTSIDVAYDATAKQLTATGLSTNLKLDGDPNNSIYASGGLDNYSLTVNIDENGELYESGGSFGSFSITGAIDYDGDFFPDGPSVLILTGEIFAFDGGFSRDQNYPTVDEDPTGTPLKYSQILEFRFEATGGSERDTYLNAPSYSALDFEGNPNRGGIILSETDFAGSWLSDWNSGINAVADTSVTSLVTPVPESTTLALQIGSLALACVAIRRRAKR